MLESLDDYNIYYSPDDHDNLDKASDKIILSKKIINQLNRQELI